MIAILVGTALSGAVWALATATMARFGDTPRSAATGALLASGFLAVLAAGLLGGLGRDAWASIGQAISGVLILIAAFATMVAASAPWLGRWSLAVALAGPGLAHLAAI